MDEQAVFDALKYRIEVDVFGTRRHYSSDNQLHRDGGPAVEYTTGENQWCQNGQLHRTDGPAVLWADGTKLWYQNGLRHRTDGAAVEFASGLKYWYINGVEMSEAEFNQEVKHHG